MKVLIQTTLTDQEHFVIRAYARAPFGSQHIDRSETATLGSVIKVRNSLIDAYTNRLDVSEVTAPAIPFPAEHYHFKRA